MNKNKIWNIAHFNGTFVFSFNQPFLDFLNPLLKDRLNLNFCYRQKTEDGISVVVIERDDVCIMADSIEQALNKGLRDGAMLKFYERLSEQLQYISNQKVNYEEWEKKQNFSHTPKIGYEKAKPKPHPVNRKFF